jgi:hypothetical protein
VPFHRLAAVVDLGQEAVVCLACERDIVQRVLATVGERVPVMELEPVGGCAASTLLVDE